MSGRGHSPWRAIRGGAFRPLVHPSTRAAPWTPSRATEPGAVLDLVKAEPAVGPEPGQP